MTDETITFQDVLDLENGYKEASRLADSTPFDLGTGYPNYPEPIKNFMLELSNSKWGYTGYDPAKGRELIEQIETATMLDLRSICTWCSRGERFMDGHWINVLQSDILDKVISRAKELTFEP